METLKALQSLYQVVLGEHCSQAVQHKRVSIDGIVQAPKVRQHLHKYVSIHNQIVHDKAIETGQDGRLVGKTRTKGKENLLEVLNP